MEITISYISFAFLLLYLDVYVWSKTNRQCFYPGRFLTFYYWWYNFSLLCHVMFSDTSINAIDAYSLVLYSYYLEAAGSSRGGLASSRYSGFHHNDYRPMSTTPGQLPMDSNKLPSRLRDTIFDHYSDHCLCHIYRCGEPSHTHGRFQTGPSAVLTGYHPASKLPFAESRAIGGSH